MNIAIIVWKHQEVWGNIADNNNNIRRSESFKYKIEITGKTPAAGNTKNVELDQYKKLDCL